jgi:hypothetical protein
MRTGKTSTGFEYQFDEQALDDMRFVDILTAVIDDETPLLDKLHGTAELIRLLLGDEQKKALYRHIGEQHGGRVPRADLEKALEEIMSSSHDVKNS